MSTKAVLVSGGFQSSGRYRPETGRIQREEQLRMEHKPFGYEMNHIFTSWLLDDEPCDPVLAVIRVAPEKEEVLNAEVSGVPAEHVSSNIPKCSQPLGA